MSYDLVHFYTVNFNELCAGLTPELKKIKTLTIAGEGEVIEGSTTLLILFVVFLIGTFLVVFIKKKKAWFILAYEEEED